MPDDLKIALDAISKLFDFDKDPPKGKWPRKVRNDELPPQRLGLRHESRDLGLPFRELVSDGQGGFRPWQPPRTQRQIETDMLREDLDMMRNFLRGRSIAPPDKKK